MDVCMYNCIALFDLDYKCMYTFLWIHFFLTHNIKMELLQITTKLEYSDQLKNLKQNCILLFFDSSYSGG